MRNLNLWQVSVKNIDIQTEERFSSCYGHYDDCAKGELYVCTSNLSVFNFDDNGVVKWTADLSEIVPIETQPVNISFLSLSNSLNVGLASGELITVADFGNNCDVVGVCEDGLLAMEWSPDQEILILVTKTLKVIVMSCTFDPISETYLLSDEFGEKEFINVGWGKKETQFHGSEGKQAAKAKTSDIEDAPVTDERVKISWRGDGNLFCVGYNANGRRKFKVFDRDGNLHSTSEKVLGLESNLSWRPSGSLIATTQKLQDKYTVSFFEKNGLKHREFTLPVNSTTTVKELLWTTDSEVLIVQCRDEAANSDIVFLYARRNYYWYLKQTLCFKSTQKINEIICESDFDTANEKRIHVLCQNGECYSYAWNWDVDHSVGKSSDDDAIVAVIDEKKVLVTGFRQTVVPPPMSNIELEFANNINSIHFISDNDTDTNSFIVSHGNKLAIVMQKQKKPLEYVVTKELDIDEHQYPFQYYNWYWLNYDTLLSMSVDGQNVYTLNQYAINGDKLLLKRGTKLPSPIAKIRKHPIDLYSAVLQYTSGEIAVYKYDDKEASLESYHDTLPAACPDFDVVSIDGETTIIGLSHKGCLYINEKLVLNNVNSYYVHTQYLLITTLKHLLICVELSKFGISDLEVYEKNETSSSVYKRKVERGSKLVIAVPNDTRTIFQMPRGNLETIQPRPLSLKIIGDYLDSLKYYEAFDLMRKQRINLNLIYDHNPKLFLSNVDVFLKTISNNSWLSLFLADLENIDVTKTMHSSSYSGKEHNTITYESSKVISICIVIRTHLQKSENSSERILPLLTTYVKKNTVEDLEQALQVIKDLKVKESEGVKLPVSSDEALKYLLYLVNVDNLFDVALGMYDFDLVLLVANKSQKDPKEYIPMLDELNEMDENYRQFNINKHLKRFKKAVECLAKCGKSRHTDLRTFVKYHSLYREALTLFSSGDEIFKEISDDYGSYLKLKKQYVEAGLVYEKAGSTDRAIECYKEALEWELLFKLAKNKSRDVLDTIISELVQSLKDEKRYTEALNILQQYGSNVGETIKCAIECSKYKTAMRLCARHDKNDLIDTHLIPNLLEEYTNTKDLVNKNRSLFVQYKNRLQVVRENKTKKEAEGYDTFTNRDIDLYSDAGSTIASSSGSGRSYRSSKNRRKHERKVASLKEGSQYEDTALVMTLHTLVTSTFELRPQVHELIIALCCCNREKEAGLLQANLETLLKEMEDNFKQIWTHELVIEATNAKIAAENVPEGVIVVPQGMASLAPHMRIAPVVQNMKWKLEDLC